MFRFQPKRYPGLYPGMAELIYRAWRGLTWDNAVYFFNLGLRLMGTRFSQVGLLGLCFPPANFNIFSWVTGCRLLVEGITLPGVLTDHLSGPESLATWWTSSTPSGLRTERRPVKLTGLIWKHRVTVIVRG